MAVLHLHFYGDVVGQIKLAPHSSGVQVEQESSNPLFLPHEPNNRLILLIIGFHNERQAYGIGSVYA